MIVIEHEDNNVYITRIPHCFVATAD